MFDNLEAYSERKLLSGFFLLALLLTLPLVLWQHKPTNDGCAYYVPMIQAFSCFDWKYAYYPMICPAFPTIAGIFALILCLKAFTAAKLTAALFFAATVIPLFFLHKQIFGRKVAILALILFVFCSSFIQYVGGGLLTTSKTFFLILSAYALVAFVKDGRWMAAGLFLIGINGLVLIRPEGVIIGALLWCVFFAVEVINSRSLNYSCRFPRKSIAVLVLSFAVCLPWMMYEYQNVGYYVTDSRQIGVLERFLPERAKDFFKNPSPALMPDEAVFPDSDFDLYAHGLQKIMQKPFRERLIRPLIKGFYHFYLFLALPVLFLRMMAKKWLVEESFLLAIILFHSTIMIVILGGCWTLKRYIIPVMPLMLGWSAVGACGLFAFIQGKIKGRILLKLLIVVIGSVLLWDGMKGIRPSLSSVKQARQFNFNEGTVWLNNNYLSLLPSDWSRLESTRTNYHCGGKPIILTSQLYFGYLAGSETIHPHHYKDSYSLRELCHLCYVKKVNFVVLEEDMVTACSELLEGYKTDPLFRLLFVGSNKQYSFKILGFNPNLKPPLVKKNST